MQIPYEKIRDTYLLHVSLCSDCVWHDIGKSRSGFDGRPVRYATVSHLCVEAKRLLMLLGKGLEL